MHGTSCPEDLCTHGSHRCTAEPCALHSPCRRASAAADSTPVLPPHTSDYTSCAALSLSAAQQQVLTATFFVSDNRHHEYSCFLSREFFTGSKDQNNHFFLQTGSHPDGRPIQCHTTRCCQPLKGCKIPCTTLFPNSAGSNKRHFK